ncbi:DUF1361 domain-containing protein [Flavobacteriaceae bacterium TP-CH-4]|uniref:DUF1361 domain-containing protein n=1 Tax=Pelagihabitans pacificus TaxID=2696054 RepID=A0A967ASJ0_9FLAO|nr:DUF1361 domain-containing protein [Pelagihabitans pacificus]NHF58138.1 DUF1361 domain-containing protein [Pelagihabitans pacificus]
MKTLLAKNRALYLNLMLSTAFALALLVFRIQLTQTYFYLFLVWNLFLAGIPFVISQALCHGRWLRNSKLLGTGSFLIWLLFLPNSPYIITDLVHLHDQASHLRWFDLFLVFVFALNGLVFGLLSLLDIYGLLAERYDRTVASYSLFKICLLSGFGIYLGRFLRFNSWDIVTKPTTLFHQAWFSMKEPKMWLFTLAFGGFLWILFTLLRALLKHNEVAVSNSYD